MSFSAKQNRALKREVDQRKVRTRQAYGKDLSFEGWFVISEANRIFGFDFGRVRLSKCVVCSTASTGAPSRWSTPPKSASAWLQTDELLSAKDTVPVKATAPRPARPMTSPSRPRKRMPPNGRSPPSAAVRIIALPCDRNAQAARERRPLPAPRHRSTPPVPAYSLLCPARNR